MSNKRLLITGGAGFIGSNFVDYIVKRYPKYKITVLDCLTYAGSIDNLPKQFIDPKSNQYKLVYGSVTNGLLVDELVKNASDVIHFAAETHVSRSIHDNKVFFETDVLGTQVVANAVNKYKNKINRFVHISTSEVYGTAAMPKMDEKHELNPASPYAAAKCGADRLVYSYWSTYNIPVVIIRPFNNYGPKQHLEKAIPRFVTSVILDETMRIHGDGSASRDFIHVYDTCFAVDLVLHAEENKVIGEVFNVGSGVDRTMLSVAEDIIRNMGKGGYRLIGDRPGQVVRHTADTTKIRDVLGWKQSIDWFCGLSNTIDWYKKNENLWRKQLWLREIPVISSAGKQEMH